ncbi:MAG TPA: transporter substrate-binding domain-containing protein [Rhizobacter sp.]|nr:transporter substrate-binding domain-containing protein [Rhizobacter sp.]
MTPTSRFLAALALTLTCGALHAQTIRAVTEPSNYSRMENGKPAGPANEIAEATLKRAGFTDYSIGMYPWARAYDMAMQEPNVLIYLIARTPEREARFKWVGEYIRVDYFLYKLRSNTQLHLRSLEQARQHSIAVTRDDVRHQYLQAQGFTRLVVAPTVGDNFKMLVNGQAELAALSEAGAAQLCEDNRFDCTRLEKAYALDALTVGIWMAYSLPTSDEVVARTRAAFDKIKASGTVARLMNAKR